METLRHFQVLLPGKLHHIIYSKAFGIILYVVLFWQNGDMQCEEQT